MADEVPVPPAGGQAGLPAGSAEQALPGSPAGAGMPDGAETGPHGVTAASPGSDETGQLSEWPGASGEWPLGQPQGLADKPPATQPAKAPAPGGDGRNVWDFLCVVVVVAGLVGLVLYLLDRSSLKPGDVESILGIVVPAFAAVFGATVGAAAGHVRGKSAGKKAARTYLMPKISLLQAARSQSGAEIHTARHVGSAADGAEMFAFTGRFAPGPAAGFADSTAIEATLGEMKGYLDSF